MVKSFLVTGPTVVVAKPLALAAAASDLPPDTSASIALAAASVGTTNWVKVRVCRAWYFAASFW